MFKRLQYKDEQIVHNGKRIDGETMVHCKNKPQCDCYARGFEKWCQCYHRADDKKCDCMRRGDEYHGLSNEEVLAKYLEGYKHPGHVYTYRI